MLTSNKMESLLKSWGLVTFPELSKLQITILFYARYNLYVDDRHYFQPTKLLAKLGLLPSRYRILKDALSELESLGFLNRKQKSNNIKPRIKYWLTDLGIQVTDLIIKINTDYKQLHTDYVQLKNLINNKV